MIINFGFNISGTKEVAVNRYDKENLTLIVSSIFQIKVFLWLFCLFILIVLVYSIPYLRSDSLLYYFTFAVTFNELLFPQWFFQGIEKMKYVTIINLIARTIFVILIFAFVNLKSEYLLVPLFNGIGALVGGVIGVYFLFKIEKIDFKFQSINNLRSYFIESLPLFISSASIQIYNNISRILVGTFLGMKEVAYFDLGHKILRVLKLPLSILTQVLFPKISREKNISYLNKMALIVLLLTSGIYILLISFTDEIVYLIAGAGMLNSIEIIRILCVSFILIGVSQFFGSMRLVPFGFNKEFAWCTVSTLIVYGLSILLLSILDQINVISMALISVFVDFWVILLLLVVNHQKGLLTMRI